MLLRPQCGGSAIFRRLLGPHHKCHEPTNVMATVATATMTTMAANRPMAVNHRRFFGNTSRILRKPSSAASSPFGFTHESAFFKQCATTGSTSLIASNTSELQQVVPQQGINIASASSLKKHAHLFDTLVKTPLKDDSDSAKGWMQDLNFEHYSRMNVTMNYASHWMVYFLICNDLVYFSILLVPGLWYYTLPDNLHIYQTEMFTLLNSCILAVLGVCINFRTAVAVLLSVLFIVLSQLEVLTMGVYMYDCQQAFTFCAATTYHLLHVMAGTALLMCMNSTFYLVQNTAINTVNSLTNSTLMYWKAVEGFWLIVCFFTAIQ